MLYDIRENAPGISTGSSPLFKILKNKKAFEASKTLA